MSQENLLDEVYKDIFEISHKIAESDAGGRIDSFRRKNKKKLNARKRKHFYSKIEDTITTKENNLWHCQVNVFSKCAIWQGYTKIKNSKGVRTVYYEWGKVFLIDSHFFSRYRERYLEYNNIEYTGSTTDYFNKENSVYSIIPVLLDELVLNDVDVLLDHGLGKGKKIDYSVNQGILGEAGRDFDLTPFKNYRINTFLGFNDLKKTQLNDIIGYMHVIGPALLEQRRENLNRFDKGVIELKIRNFNLVFEKVLPRLKEYT